MSAPGIRHTIVIEVPEGANPGEVELALTEMINQLWFSTSATSTGSPWVVEYHHEQMTTTEEDCVCDAPSFSRGAHHAKDCPMKED